MAPATKAQPTTVSKRGAAQKTKSNYVRVRAGSRRNVTLRGGAGVDLVAGPIRMVIHPLAVTAGHDPMEIRAVNNPKGKTLKTKAGKIEPIGPSVQAKLNVDGTRRALVLAAKTPKTLKLKPGQRLVVLATFASNQKTARSASKTAKIGKPVGTFENPIISASDRIVADAGLFSFEDPVISFEDPVIVVEKGKSRGKRSKAAATPSSPSATLGFHTNSPTGSVYIGPASLSADGMVGLIASKGTLKEVRFGVLTPSSAR